MPLTQAQRRASGPVIAFWLSLGWLAAVVAVAAVLTRQGQGLGEALGLVVIALAVFLPVVLIWLAVLVLRAAAAMTDQASRIEAALDRLRRMAVPVAPETLSPHPDPDPTLTLFVSRRDSQRGADSVADAAPGQRGLAFDPPRPGAAPLGPDDLIRALEFPRDAADAQGFDVLRRGLHDPGSAELIRAAQEVLAGLAAEGIEIRDLTPDRARPEVWRAFAQGARGQAIAALGGVRDRSVLALTAGRMRADPAFREAAHRFLRAFDRRLTAFEAQASDAQIARLAETRGARAFMVLGRVTGMFG